MRSLIPLQLNFPMKWYIVPMGNVLLSIIQAMNSFFHEKEQNYPENRINKPPLLVDDIQLNPIEHLLESIQNILLPLPTCNDQGFVLDNTKYLTNPMEHCMDAHLLVQNPNLVLVWNILEGVPKRYHLSHEWLVTLKKIVVAHTSDLQQICEQTCKNNGCMQI